MSEQAPGVEKTPLRIKLASIFLGLAAKAILVLLAGALSMFFGEVLSGSSVLWFATSWAWLVTFWLYLAHILLFINLALIFRRTSLTSLYLWGVLFGLYESWITKVTWAGYMGSAPGWGTFLGFAFPESPLIVFFWHPVFSFILPVLCFEILSGKNNVLPEHRPYLARTAPNYLLALLFVVIGALFLSTNAKGSVPAVVLSILGSVAIIGVLYLIARGILRLIGWKFSIEALQWGPIGKILLFAINIINIRSYGKPFSIESLRLGIIGMLILLGYLAALYIFMFLFLFPGRIAPLLTLLLTLGIYAAVIVLLYLKKPAETVVPEANTGKAFFNLKDLAILLAVLIVLGTLLCLVTPLDFPLIMVCYLVLVLAGPVLFLLAIVLSVTGARKNNAVNA